MGLFDSLFGGKQKSSSTTEGYKPFVDYIRGRKGEGNEGMPQQIYDLYQNSGFTPGMQDATNSYLQNTNFAQKSPNITSNDPNFRNPVDNFQGFNASSPMIQDYAKASSDLLGGAYKVANGAYDSDFGPVAGVDLNAERAKMGKLDPTNSLSSLLSGKVNNPYLDSQADAMIGSMTRNLNENVMPGIRSNAVVSGTYGGSRQGIAEGLAASRLNQDIAPALTNLYGTANENAQNRMASTANSLNDQAYNAGFGNAGLQMQNNQQLMQKNAGNLSNRMQALPIAQGGFGMLSGLNDMAINNTDLGIRGADLGIRNADVGFKNADLGLRTNEANNNNFANYMQAIMGPQAYDWQNMQNYANLMYGGAGIGGSGTNQQSQSAGIGNTLLGLGAGAAGIYSGFK